MAAVPTMHHVYAMKVYNRGMKGDTPLQGGVIFKISVIHDRIVTVLEKKLQKIRDMQEDGEDEAVAILEAYQKK